MACMIDFRCLDEGLGGERTKRKRKRCDDEVDEQQQQQQQSAVAEMDTDMAMDPPLPKRLAMAEEGQNKPSSATACGRATYDGIIAGRVSGRKWKQAKPSRASSLRVSHKPFNADDRARMKQTKKAFQARMADLKKRITDSKIEQRKQREERQKRKEENTLRSGLKLQKITNPKTLKKIAKSKHKKKLRVVPDELLKKK